MYLGWGIFVIFVFVSSRRLFHLVFTLNMHEKNLRISFFGYLYRSNGAKTRLDALLYFKVNSECNNE